jgi:hypothetical protein
MIEAPRPSTLGEILDRTANIYRNRFLLFLGTAILPVGVVLACAVAAFLFLAWIGYAGGKAEPALVGVLVILLFVVGILILLPLSMGALGLGAGALNQAAVAVFQNEEVTIRQAYKAAWKRGWQYIWLLILEGLILVVAPSVVLTTLIMIFAVSEGLTGKSANEAGPAVGGLMMLLLAVMAVYALCMLLMLCLSFPACVAENVSAWTALKRSNSLSKGTRGRILVLYILGMVLRWGLGLVLTIPVILVITLVPGLDTPQHSQVIGTVVLLVIYGGSFLLRAFTKPVYVIAQLLFYYDQRIRKEGFDIEWMMRQAGMVAAPIPPPEAAPWMPALPRKQGVPQPLPEPGAEGIAAHSEVPKMHPVPQAAAPLPIANEANLPPDSGTLQPAPGESA